MGSRLGLKNLSVEEIAELRRGYSNLHSIPVFFHPNQKKLARFLKRYEKATVYTTPTSEGFEVETQIQNLTENSKEGVEKEIQKIRGIQLIFRCPHCGEKITLRGAK